MKITHPPAQKIWINVELGTLISESNSKVRLAGFRTNFLMFSMFETCRMSRVCWIYGAISALGLYMHNAHNYQKISPKLVYLSTFCHLMIILKLVYLNTPSPKTNMTGWNTQHEGVDVFPIENGDFPMS